MNENIDNWEEHWEKYALAAQLNPAQAYRHKIIISELEKTACANLLDIGSGQGDFLYKVSKAIPQAKLCGFELSESGVKITKAKVPEAQALVVDLFNPSKESSEITNWATHATCSEVLEHVDNPVEFLKASRKFIRENGTIVISVPGGPMSAYDKYIGHRQHFTKKSITKIMMEAGYKPETIMLAGFPFFNLYRLLVILRGQKLIKDTDATSKPLSTAAQALMQIFSRLFKWNKRNSALGWQVIAVGKKI